MELSWEDFSQLIDEMASSIGPRPDAIVGIARGGLPGLTALAARLGVRDVGVAFVRSTVTDAEFAPRLSSVVCNGMQLPGAERFRHVLIFDDIARSGRTMDAAHVAVSGLGIPSVSRAALFGEATLASRGMLIAREIDHDTWVRFPWDDWPDRAH